MSLSIDRRRADPYSLARSGPARIVIYGTHSRSWTTALAPDAPVWTLLPLVRDVLTVPADGTAPVPDAHDGIRTILLPLMERHILACPSDRHWGLIPSPRAVTALADKAVFAEHVRRLGLARFCPQHYASPDEVGFPCVVKRRDLNGGNGVALAEGPERLRQLLGMAPWAGHPILLQAYELARHQYATHAICRDGRLVKHLSYRQTILDGDVIRRGGQRILCESFDPSAEHLDAMERMLVPLGYSGPCCVDYTLRANGSLCVFEINPRLGGSLMRPENLWDLATLLSGLIDHAQPLSTAGAA